VLANWLSPVALYNHYLLLRQVNFQVFRSEDDTQGVLEPKPIIAMMPAKKAAPKLHISILQQPFLLVKMCIRCYISSYHCHFFLQDIAKKITFGYDTAYSGDWNRCSVAKVGERQVKIRFQPLY
jgi:hypothetical protein